MNNDFEKNRQSSDPADSCAVSAAQCPGRTPGAGIPDGKRQMCAMCSLHRGRGKGIFDNRYKMVSLDMDGTLLMSDKSIHPDTAADIAAAAGRGIEVIYCTGRALPEILPYAGQLPEIRYGVCVSGAFVYDFHKRQSIAGSMMDAEIVKKIVEAGETHGAMVQFLAQDATIVREGIIERMPEFNMGVFQSLFRETATVVPDMGREAEKQGGVPKVNLYFPAPGERQKVYDALKSLPLEFAFVDLDGSFALEMTAEGTTKASGLVALADHLGIPMQEVMAIGDSPNDRQVLESAGFAVAMGNAPAQIKDLCGAVTDDNDHNGVGKAIRKYCFSPGQ